MARREAGPSPRAARPSGGHDDLRPFLRKLDRLLTGDLRATTVTTMQRHAAGCGACGLEWGQCARVSRLCWRRRRRTTSLMSRSSGMCALAAAVGVRPRWSSGDPVRAVPDTGRDPVRGNAPTRASAT